MFKLDIKCLILGFILGASLINPVKALEISFDQITLRDFFAGCALAGLTSNPNYKISGNPVEEAWYLSGELMKRKKYNK